MWWTHKHSRTVVRARARMGPLDGQEVEVSRDASVVALARPVAADGRTTVDYRLYRSASGRYLLDYLEEQRPADPAS